MVTRTSTLDEHNRLRRLASSARTGALLAVQIAGLTPPGTAGATSCVT